LDRVKPNARFVDPADELAHPERHAFMSRHARSVRTACLLLGLVAAVCGALLFPLAPLIVVAAWAAVLIYGRPRTLGWRPKDVFVLKNLCVAGSAAALSLAGAAMIHPSALHEIRPLARLVAWGIVLTLIVFADAVLCDLDDVPGDAPFGTRTFPVVSGPRMAWRVANICHIVAAVGLSAAALLGWTTIVTPLLAGWGLLATNLLLKFLRPAAVRPWVDLRLGLFGCVAWLTLVVA
ncbi:MAG: UbiA family prenyltransferase, partial [Phycisphaerales bacterium]|nr:UbiA family prenyltransferase [Phycisphaerales bacterium]